MPLDRWHIPTSDEEVVEIFFEEAGELLENVDNHMETWRKNPGDKNALSEIRRSFHTLKGSGRMVKALDLADVAWKVENMLNQAIAGAVPASAFMVKLVASVRAQIPRMVDAMKNHRSIAKDRSIVSLMKLADALAAGKGPSSASTPIAATGGRQHFKPSERNPKLEGFMQRADEALHRSEMALQQARRSSTQIDALQQAVIQQDCRAEVQRIGERVNLLSKGIADSRVESTKSQIGSIYQESEMNRLVEKRVRARMASAEALNTGFRQDIEENRQAITALRRFMWLVVILSAMVGAGVAIGLLLSIPSLG